ncbi:MAG: hypothetical protein L0215_21135 [Gemmataceae bacterium]|nr:hypothetical protein [Gemmataceae bacterium]
MDGRQLRKGAGGPNFRPSVDLWWHVVKQAGEHHVPQNEMALVFAECYPLVNTAKALQDVYVDAHLHANADREYSFEDENGVRQRRAERTYLLPDEDVERLRQIAHSRNTDLIRSELERLFLGELPPAHEMPAFVEAAQAWIGNGIVALRREDRAGLQRYTHTVDEWIRKFRRRGGIDRVRMFVNMFSYDCKAAFYMCYANAWTGILESLRQSGDIDPLSERFMRLWHHQNRAADEAEVHRDVFCGQILALHPLSAIVLTSPQHLEVIGNYLGLTEHDALVTDRRIVETEEYWDMVSTVLVAAHEYDRSRRRWDETRDHSILTSSDLVEQQARDDATASVRVFFEEYVAARRRFCPECSGTLSFVRHEPGGTADSPAAIVHLICMSCNRETAIEVGQDDVLC